MKDKKQFYKYKYKKDNITKNIKYLILNNNNPKVKINIKKYKLNEITLKKIINLTLLLKIYFFLILIFEKLTQTKNIGKRKLNEINSEISIIIYGTGTQNIINRFFSHFPDQILINGECYNSSNECQVNDLINEMNKIVMKWNDKLKTCQNMFKGLLNIIEIDFSNFDTSEVTSMANMFYNCTNLISIKNINHFNTLSVKNMECMFCFCNSLLSLDLSSFDTRNVKNMACMFFICPKLSYLDISNFNTSSTEDMNYMFTECFSLTSLDISNFDTSLVKDMSHMFHGCNSLISLNVSSFNTSLVKKMEYMFYDLKQIESLDILNFDTSKVTNMEGLFLNCQKLTFLNLSNLNTSNVLNMQSMFYGCHNLINIDLTNFDTSSVIDMKFMFWNCKSLKSLDLSSFNTESVINMTYMFYNCINLNYINLYSFTENNNLVIENIFENIQNIKFYCIYNESKTPQILLVLNQKGFINNCSHFCFDKNSKYILEKRICIDECINDDFYQFHYENMCYSNCPNGTNNSIKNYYECERIKYKDSIQYIKYVQNCSTENFFKKICSIDNNNPEMIDEMVKNIKEDIKNKNIDYLLSNILYGDKNDLLIIDNLTIYQITSTENQNNNEYNYTSTIKLGECENILKEKYNISQDISLLIFKMEYFIKEFKMPS